jgi:amino acid transporter
MNAQRIKQFFFGKPLDPTQADTRKHLALITFFAWVGIGADGLSSANYGPAVAFLALGEHTHMAIFLAIATAITVFLIAAAYTQVIELFPNGGGGYRVTTHTLGPKFGLVAGGALLVDYVLTIAISIASGVDALFSLMPLEWQGYKLVVACGVVLLLTYSNLRGMKESIKLLLPIFLGFVVTHVALIGYAIFAHASDVPNLIPNAMEDSTAMAEELGWLAVIALFFKAFSLGGGTYTGLEAVSNSVQNFAEPRVKTGRATMWAVAFSLAIMAAGIILMYLLWDVQRVEGETLNASAFRAVTSHWEIAGVNISGEVVSVALLFAMGLLFVAANTGFIAGPAVLASMATDRWMPHMFSGLSSRLVTKDGVVLFGVLAIGALLITGGDVYLLVILYSINVFMDFTLSIGGLTRYRAKRIGRGEKGNSRKLFGAGVAFVVCAGILVMTVLEKFSYGGWKTVLVTGLVILLGLTIRKHYRYVSKRLQEVEDDLAAALYFAPSKINAQDKPKMDPKKPTAVFLVGGSAASGMHTFLWVQRLFPDVYQNVVFASVGEIESREFADADKWNEMETDTKTMLKNYVDFCTRRGMPATYYHGYGTDVVQSLAEMTETIQKDFPKSVFFATKLIFEKEKFYHGWLHNQTAYMLQKKLHARGQNLIVMPMKI